MSHIMFYALCHVDDKIVIAAPRAQGTDQVPSALGKPTGGSEDFHIRAHVGASRRSTAIGVWICLDLTCLYGPLL